MVTQDPTVSGPAADLNCDVAVVGAGPVGLTLALLLAARANALRVMLVDARAADAGDTDPRVLALSHGSRLLLERTGAWPAAPGDTTPIHHIHVSQRHHFGRAVIGHDEHDVPALGYVVRYGTLLRTLDAALAALPAHAPATLRGTRAIGYRQDAQGVTLTLQDAHTTRSLRAALAINAEGGLFTPQPALAEAMAERPAMLTHRTPAGRHRRDYRQSAVVGFVTCRSPKPYWAWERFTAEGPLALLPLENGYALVWCCAHDEAQRRLALDDAAFLAELRAAFGERMGAFDSITGRAAFALGMNALTHLVDGRVAAIGNAAQTLHPVAGQGLNLGLRDAFALAEALAATPGGDATPAALARFNRRRALDRRLTIGITDWLPRLFSNDIAPLATLRGLALGGLELVPPLKTAFARHMMFGQRH